MTALTVVYDSSCGLCSSAREWVLAQTALVPVEFVAAKSSEADTRFPGLPDGELAVVADTGDVWLGNPAWIVCLWALRDYTDWAVRLSSPLLLMMAREAFAAVSRNKLSISALLKLRSDQEVEQQLRKIAVPQCIDAHEKI